MASSQDIKTVQALWVGRMASSLSPVTHNDTVEGVCELTCVENGQIEYSVKSVTLHDQQFEKIWRMASRVSEEACARPNPTSMVGTCVMRES